MNTAIVACNIFHEVLGGRSEITMMQSGMSTTDVQVSKPPFVDARHDLYSNEDGSKPVGLNGSKPGTLPVVLLWRIHLTATQSYPRCSNALVMRGGR